MTESEWLTGASPAAMLNYIIAESTHPRSGALALDTSRKLRLFAVACCRQVWDGTECRACRGEGTYDADNVASYVIHKMTCRVCHGTGKVGGLTDPRSRAAVEWAERQVDGESVPFGVATAAHEARQAAGNADRAAWNAAWLASMLLVEGRVDLTAREIADPSTGVQQLIPPATQAALLRCVMGNPWRPKLCMRQGPHVHAANEEWQHSPEARKWLSWNSGTVAKLAARQIYEDREWGSMPVLADALEEAGCRDARILWHLRGGELCVCEGCNEEDDGCKLCIDPRNGLSSGVVPGGVFCRGDWAVDLILGKS